MKKPKFAGVEVIFLSGAGDAGLGGARKDTLWSELRIGRNEKTRAEFWRHELSQKLFDYETGGEFAPELRPVLKDVDMTPEQIAAFSGDEGGDLAEEFKVAIVELDDQITNAQDWQIIAYGDAFYAAKHAHESSPNKTSGLRGAGGFSEEYGDTVFAAHTRGGRYAVEVRQHQDGTYRMATSTHGQEDGAATGYSRAQMINRIEKLLRDARDVDGINYQVFVDKLGLTTKFPGAVDGLGGVSKQTRKGTRVRFIGSRVGYTHAPKPNEEGTVTTMPGYGARTYLPGPGGGLLYVTWDESGTLGVSPNDVDKVQSKGGGTERKSQAAQYRFNEDRATYTLDEIAETNQETPELIRDLKALDVGETLDLINAGYGWGADSGTTITRVR